MLVPEFFMSNVYALASIGLESGWLSDSIQSSPLIRKLKIFPKTENTVLEVIVKIPFGAHPAPQPEDIGRGHFRIEFHVVAGSVPEKTGLAQEIVHLVGLAGVQAQFP